MTKKILIFIIIAFPYNFLNSSENSYIDWQSGKIYSTVSFSIKNDYNYPHKKLYEINIAREKAKINYYKILKEINFSESISVIDYIEQNNIITSDLFSLIDNAILDKIEYPNLNTIKLSYFISIYGDNSLVSIIMNEQDIYTEDLRSYEGYNFKTNYSGIIIDARGVLDSFDGYKVKVEPSIFLTIKDSEDRLVFNQHNVLLDVIKSRGMVRYSYNINENQRDIVGDNPFKIVAYSVGDRTGSVIIVSVDDAKKMLASEYTRNSIRNGKIVIVIDE